MNKTQISTKRNCKEKPLRKFMNFSLAKKSYDILILLV